MDSTNIEFRNDNGEPMALRAVEAFNGWEIRIEGKPYEHLEPIATHINHGSDHGEAIAKRLVECFNACAGFSSEFLLDDGVNKTKADRDELLAKNENLIAECLNLKADKAELVELLKAIAADNEYTDKEFSITETLNKLGA